MHAKKERARQNYAKIVWKICNNKKKELFKKMKKAEKNHCTNQILHDDNFIIIYLLVCVRI